MKLVAPNPSQTPPEGVVNLQEYTRTPPSRWGADLREGHPIEAGGRLPSIV